MRRYILITTLLLVFYTSTTAQVFETFMARTEFFSGDKFESFFSREHAFTMLSKISTSPVESFYGGNVGSSEFVSVRDPYFDRYLNIFGYQHEFRLNLIEYYSTVSLSVNAPVGLNFNYLQLDEVVNFSFETGLLAQLNFFRNATYEDIDKLGFRMGAGYLLHYSLVPVLDEPANIYPVIRLGITFPVSETSGAIDLTTTPYVKKIISLDNNGDVYNVNYTDFYISLRMAVLIN